MTISYNVGADVIKPVRNRTKESEEIIAVREFLESGNDNMSFTYEDINIARKKRNNVAVSCRKRGLPIKALLRGNSIIIVRAK